MVDDLAANSKYVDTTFGIPTRSVRERLASHNTFLKAFFYVVDCCYLIRVFSCFNGAFLVWCLASTQTSPAFWRIRVAIISFCALGSAFSLNDALDIEEDQINSAKRPVAAGRISRKVALSIYSLLGVIGVYFGLTLHSFSGSCIAIVMVALASFYSFVVKPLWPLKTFVAAVMVTSLPILAWSSNSPLFIHRKMGFAVILFFWSWEKELLADIRDLAGDARSGLMTLPRRIGPRLTLFLIVTLNLSLWLSIYASIRPDHLAFICLIGLALLHTAILLVCIAISSPQWLRRYLRVQIAVTSLGLAVTYFGSHLYGR
jgi:4-hydroxybenzoate polyprenyltransferase